MNYLAKRCLTATLLVFTGLTAVAEEDAATALVDELRRELQRGEQQRLADPWFLRDLQQILDKYDQPWREIVLNSPFNGPDQLPAEPWQIRTGEFLIDWRLGLRSVVRDSAPAGNQGLGKSEDEDIAKALFGALLEQAIKGESGQDTASGSDDSGSEVAWMQAKTRFSNAFSLSFNISQRVLEGSDRGEFMIGPFTRREPEGYRLFLQPGRAQGEASIQLVRYSANGGAGVVDRLQQPLRLADGTMHQVVWTRDSNGQMQVSVDGQVVLQGPDRSIGSRFQGIEMSNKGGDFAIRDLVLRAGQ